MGVFAGTTAAACVTSSLALTPTTPFSSNKRTTITTSSSKCRIRATHHQNLTAFPSTSHLFYAKSLRTTKPRIFLPHLIASLEQVDQTYIMVKPDGVQRGVVGDIISRFEKKGFKLTGLKLYQCSKDLAEEHYKDLKLKSFFPKLIDYITSGPVVCMAWEGVGVVASARKLIGATDPLQAEPGTIRGDLAVQTGRNIVHGSDSPENGKREIALWFKEGELCEWTPVLTPWLRE
ncbi:nucleoside diphosphate kinase 2, chloroplastic isoform X1 [Lotus japonicus]|uniref:nucleoside diphosphate kinase 2, chloroplastic isoform X1 n=1 Tax=Lotus japonicus TaxID=34305 RepID=UPI00258CB807|nr:nucleoside diphosphate kinase 2, chloroplastic isoform X1 [Lotus japonicus]